MNKNRPTLARTIVFFSAGLLCSLGLSAQIAIQRAQTLSCEQGDNVEGGCCCYKAAHTYRFEPVTVTRLGVTFDTGGGLGCESQVAIQALTRNGWQNLRAVDAVSSSGRSEAHRLGGLFELRETLSGVRIDDRGRCHIDYSEIRLEVAAEDPPRLEYDPRSAALASGTYRVQVISDQTVESIWHLERAGSRITGSSEWGCCPPQRIDPLTGSIEGDSVAITRDCSSRGLASRCEELYEGTVVGGSIQGSFSRNGRFAGRWSLELGTPHRPVGDKPVPDVVEIVADPPTACRVGSTVTLRQQPRPVRGARWFFDGKAISTAETLRWHCKEVGSYRIALRSHDDEVLDSYQIDVDQEGTYRLIGKQLSGEEEARAYRERGVRNDNRELVLRRSASVQKIEGNARRYCIWTMTDDHGIGQRVICGGDEAPILGAILLPGRYVVFPSLADHQRYCEVTVYVRER